MEPDPTLYTRYFSCHPSPLLLREVILVLPGLMFYQEALVWVEREGSDGWIGAGEPFIIATMESDAVRVKRYSNRPSGRLDLQLAAATEDIERSSRHFQGRPRGTLSYASG